MKTLLLSVSFHFKCFNDRGGISTWTHVFMCKIMCEIDSTGVGFKATNLDFNYSGLHSHCTLTSGISSPLQTKP